VNDLSAGDSREVGGSLGTLIGADLLNLGKISGLGTPVASIGGAATFDAAIPLTGILSIELPLSLLVRAEELLE
jgi:uncharacterized membrane protein